MYYGQKIFLRQIEVADLPKIMAYRNTYETRKYLGLLVPDSELSEKQWIEKAATFSPFKDRQIVFVIEDLETRTFLGTTDLHQINLHTRRAEFGIAIYQPSTLDKGYGTDATLVTLWVAFHILGLNSVMLRVADNNARAIHVYEKVGFKHVGRHRQSYFVEGKFSDDLIMDILQSEFFEKYPPGTFIGKFIPVKNI